MRPAIVASLQADWAQHHMGQTDGYRYPFSASGEQQIAESFAMNQATAEQPSHSPCAETEREIQMVVAHAMNYIFSGNSMAGANPALVRKVIDDIMSEASSFRQQASAAKPGTPVNVNGLKEKIGPTSKLANDYKHRLKKNHHLKVVCGDHTRRLDEDERHKDHDHEHDLH